MKTSWQLKRLSDVCGFQNGFAFKSALFKESGCPILRISNLQNGKVDMDGLAFFDPKDYRENLDRYRIVRDDLLIAMSGATTGKLGWNTHDWIFYLNQRVGKFEPGKNIDKRFLYYFLSTKVEENLRISAGAAQPNLSTEQIRGFLIVVPPLDDQHRIVGILDEAFEGIATAKANAEKNRQNARALFESHIQSVFTQRGEGWVDRTLDQVCIVERGSSPRPIKNYFTTAPDGVNWIKIGDTEEGGKYVYSTAQKITPNGAKHSRFVKEGDLILTNSMSFGRPYIMKTSGYIHDGWFVLRLRDSMDTDYFYYLLSSKYVQMQFGTLAAGAIVKNISGDLVKRAVLPIPPLSQQRALVKLLLVLSEETRRLESIYQQKLAALDDLKKALLHQAFSGQL
jgi:type I restriction enzyme S subunit